MIRDFRTLFEEEQDYYKSNIVSNSGIIIIIIITLNLKVMAIGTKIYH